jgi:hypothetical protein
MGKTFAGAPDLGAFGFLGSPLFPPPKLGFPALLGGAAYWFAGGPAGSSSAPPQQNISSDLLPTRVLSYSYVPILFQPISVFTLILPLNQPKKMMMRVNTSENHKGRICF